jgi:glutamate racemase
MPSTSDLAIGVFDSGVGGLTVLRALQERLPNEHTVYLGDTARVPYGTRSQAVVTRYALGNGRFLLDQRIKLLVVACNTVSAESLPAMRAALDVPILGVVEPGAAAAVERARGRPVGVIGTPGTIASGAYQRAIAQLAPALPVTARTCPLFVPLAEEGWTEGDVPRLVAQRYLSDFIQENVGALVLGCTHYPLLRGPIAEVLGPGVELVDSARATAEAVARALDASGLARTGPGPAGHRTFVTDLPASFHRVAARFLGRPLAHLEQVDVRV